MKGIAIKANNITKSYTLYNNQTDRLKDALMLGRKKIGKSFYALEDITFEVQEGESIGIIGKNGSGKSTLLKILTGVLTKSSGDFNVNGKVSALLELGAGFNPEYTGLENIYLSGTIMGYSKIEIEEKLDEIISFADIGDFINQPVKNYSSGMFVRLAFSVAINVDPDILIVDEALSVGDIRFQQKCLRKIEQLKNEKTIIFVSHDLLTLNKFCDRLIWINEGRIVDQGDPVEISKKYQAFMAGSELNVYKENGSAKEEFIQKKKSLINEIDPIHPSLQIFGDNKATITGISVFDMFNNKIDSIQIGERVLLSIIVKFNERIQNPIIGFTIKDRVGNIVTQTNSFVLNQAIDDGFNGQEITYSFEIQIPNLKKGYYTISPAVASGSQYDHTQHCWIHDALVIKINDNQEYDLEGFLVLEETKFKVL
ncbi:ABC transporter ATP-binding protein [Cytobacillus sp.]|uniref:ABC transporter ATP-binding protein n=1 Tax=Cytobacillus sp. TaxID=2675269 RepID=UPI0028BE239A|nr:ABC transporter ATP-binding protein [Cytobacillus sp.]